MFNVLTRTQSVQEMPIAIAILQGSYCEMLNSAIRKREINQLSSWVPRITKRIMKTFAMILGVFTRLIELLQDFERIFELFCDGDGNEQLEGTLCSCFFQNFHTFSTQPHCFWHRRTGIFRKSRMPSYPCFLLDDCRPPLIK